MNSTTKSLTLKTLLSIIIAVLIQQSIANCQIKSEYTRKNFSTIDQLNNEVMNDKSDNYFPGSINEDEFRMACINYNSASNSGILSELSCKEEIESEMLIEDWMIHEFKIDSNLTNSVDAEEEMKIEEWMTQPAHWDPYNVQSYVSE